MHVPLKVKERELAEFFSEFGSVAYCQVVKDHHKDGLEGELYCVMEWLFQYGMQHTGVLK